MRIANRFLILSGLALAVLVGLGWSGLRVRSTAKFALLACLILFEYLWLPYPTQRIEHPAYYEQLASSENAGAVLHIPFTSTPDTVHNMLAQTAHNRPIAGGYLSTTPPEAERFIEDDRLLSRLSGLRPSSRQRIDADHLRELGFGTVILHKDPRGYLPSLPASADFGRRRREMGRPGLDYRELGRFMRAFERALGEPVYEDEKIVVFEVSGDG